MAKQFLRFITLQDISLAVRFTLSPADEVYELKPTLRFEIATATPVLGYNEFGEYTDSDKFHLLGNGIPVDKFDDATFLVVGNVMEPMNEAIEGHEPTFVLSGMLQDTAMFKREFRAFSDWINSGYLEKVYKEEV